MADFYPIILVVVSFILGIIMFFCFQPKDEPEKKDIYSVPTENIDKMINNSNKGKSGMLYRNNLQRYNVKYAAWRAGRNGENK